MIRILYGCSGCGKSKRIYQLMTEDVEKGTPSYLIVPEQETVRCERRLLDILPPRAQLSSEVLNFSRLANLVFRKFGGLSYNYADKGSKTLVMWKNLRELAPLLNEYSRSAETNLYGFSSEMISAVGELKAYCVTPAKLERAAEKLDSNPILKRKLLDLSLIAASYQNFFSESYSDAADDLTKLANILKDKDLFSGKNVYIDSFTSFTAQEYDVIEGIFRQAKNVTIAITVDSLATNQIHYESTADTAAKLFSLAQKLSVPFMGERCEGDSNRCDALETVANRFWEPKLTPYEGDVNGAVSVISCATPYEEANAAADTVLDLMMQGVRCREIAVIARDASLYRGIIDTAFEKARIPYFLSQNSDITSKPIIKFLMSALRIKIYNWRREDVIAYLKSGFCGVDTRDSDLYECYLSVWSLRAADYLGDVLTMNPDGYSTLLTERGKEILRRINTCKDTFVPPLIRLFTRLDDAKTASDMCVALYLFMEEQGLSQSLSEEAEAAYKKGKRREAAELLQLYNAVIKALEGISSILDDCDITIKEFFDALRIMLDSISVGAIPTGEDQVIIGSASMLRTSGIKCAILLGVNEGEFPQTVKESGLFSDNDKNVLESLGISLSADTSKRSADELFYAYRAITSPSERLFLMYHRTDLAGASASPSMVLERTLKLFAPMKEIRYEDLPPEKRLLSPELALERLAEFKNTPAGNVIREYFDSFETHGDKISASDIPSRNALCKLSDDTVSSVYGKDLRLTQTIIDDYVSCPFEYMCRRLITLQDVAPASFDYANFGTFVHYVFENYLKIATADERIGQEPNPYYITHTVNTVADEYIEKFFPNGIADSPRLVFRLNRMRRLVDLVSTAITREFAQSGFRPEFFELPIGRLSSEGPSVSPLFFKTQSGHNAYVVGKVDRVDILRKDGDVYVRVVDYKSGKKTFSQKDIDTGENVQLPLYLFALCDEKQYGLRRELQLSNSNRIIPAGAIYLSSLIEPVEISDSKYDRDLLLTMAEDSIVRSGFLLGDEEILRQMSFELSDKYLCGAKLSKDGTLSGASLLSPDGMDSLRQSLEDAVLSIADRMILGNMDAAPSCKNNKYRCENCKMQAVCRSKKK